MTDGKGCKCAAYDESECGCDADWTPQELIDARAEIARLRLTDEERKAVTFAVKQMKYLRADNAAATLRALLERTK